MHIYLGFFTFSSNKNNSDLSVFLSHYLPTVFNFKWGIYVIVWWTFLSPVDSNKFNALSAALSQLFPIREINLKIYGSQDFASALETWG
jgi:hypothetical protein